jgi:phage head maturation protease
VQREREERERREREERRGTEGEEGVIRVQLVRVQGLLEIRLVSFPSGCTGRAVSVEPFYKLRRCGAAPAVWIELIRLLPQQR